MVPLVGLLLRKPTLEQLLGVLRSERGIASPSQAASAAARFVKRERVEVGSKGGERAGDFWVCPNCGSDFTTDNPSSPKRLGPRQLLDSLQ